MRYNNHGLREKAYSPHPQPGNRKEYIMAYFTQENNAYYVESDERSANAEQEPPVQIEYVYSEPTCGSKSFFSLPARICLWFVGVIVGVTLIFGCGIFWMWGLDYIGVIDTGRSSGSNDSSQSGGNDYSEFEDFYDYFDDYFGGSGSAPDSGSNDSTTTPKPGIGVTIQEIILDFTIDDLYTGGLVIVEISENGALAGTEAQVGDLIVAVNGTPCPNFDTLDAQIAATGIGGEMVLTLARYTNGVAATFEVPITLIDMNAIN